jgi:periplasmic divalent cation tolerance protein
LDSSAIVVLITASSVAEARKLADMLVEDRLAACVQILPSIDSVYRWKGSVERASEVLLMAKTLEPRFQELETRVREVHSYETPEIVAIKAVNISQTYYSWLFLSTE